MIYLSPGYIVSENDGDLHYIGCYQLAHLYGLKAYEWKVYSATTPDDAIVLGPRQRPEGYEEGRKAIETMRRNGLL